MRLLRLLVPIAALCLALAGRVPSALARGAAPRARAANHYLAGIGDEQPEMFGDPLWLQLHTKIARYIAPWDAVAHRDELTRATAWIRGAEEQHVQLLVAFYHSEHSPSVLPSVAQYRHDVQKFLKRFPYVHQYQAWDEANRGTIRGVLASPSASTTARYYQALKRLCTKCTVIGLDVLDQANIAPTLEYISEFKREVGRLHTVMPSTWGLHDYSDVNRRESWRTRDVGRALGGRIWLTETGGIVHFGGLFPNRHGSGLTRAARVINYTFALAGSEPQVSRLYLYQWTGGVNSTRFDAGLTDVRHRPRAGYVVVCHHLHGAKCHVKVSNH
jgi:hypothetical protein